MFSGRALFVSLGSAFLCNGFILERGRSVDASYGGRGGLRCFRLLLLPAQQQRELLILAWPGSRAHLWHLGVEWGQSAQRVLTFHWAQSVEAILQGK